MIGILLKATGIWFVIVLAAIMNGMLREKILVPIIGSNLALPLSGVSLAIIVFVASLIFIPFIGASEAKVYIAIGLFWVVLTLLFEFIFGHFVAGKPWKDVMQVFNVKKGDLFLVVLCVTAISPWFAAKVRGLF
ncbi:MAG: hypothetical protein L3J26_02730 [Candidatus Polarisedimenticolaceae bacterium]|nr:hypothetical protein [Candidatus Polarisedimenticolaceae bacterium]